MKPDASNDQNFAQSEPMGPQENRSQWHKTRAQEHEQMLGWHQLGVEAHRERAEWHRARAHELDQGVALSCDRRAGHDERRVQPAMMLTPDKERRVGHSERRISSIRDRRGSRQKP